MMKTLIIINGRYRNKPAASRVLREADAHPDIKTVFTGCPGQAGTLAARAAECEMLVAAGGDGTVFEVLNAMDLKNQTLGVIPLGRSNAFACDLGLKSPEKALAAIREGRPRQIDIIECLMRNENTELKKYFLSTAGLGIAQAVPAFANQHLKTLGNAGYMLAACLLPLVSSPLRAVIQVNGGPAQAIAFNIFVLNNTPHMGMLEVFPGARMDDGIFDFFYGRTNFFTQFAWNIAPADRLKDHQPGKQSAARLSLRLEKPEFVALDGEQLCPAQEITFRIAPLKLKVMT